MRELLFREGHLSISERKKLEVLKTNYRPKKRPRQRFPNPLRQALPQQPLELLVRIRYWDLKS